MAMFEFPLPVVHLAMRRNTNEFDMQHAVMQNNLKIVRKLIAAGVSVDILNERGETLLHSAVYYKHYEVAQLLIDSKCDLDIGDPRGLTPLMWAVEFCRNEKFAALLIRAGADLNRSDRWKRTALHLAVFYRRTSVIQILLEKEGLDLSPQDLYGDTPLHYACQRQHFFLDATKQLLDAGADTNVKNNHGRTALSECILRGKFEEISRDCICLFVQKGAFLENCDYEHISRSPFLRENVLKDVELCTQSVVNKFNHQSLPALNNIACFARKLPNVVNFKLRARHVDEVENLVKCDIERNTFCNVVKVRPMALSALCVLSLITCQSGKKRDMSS